MEEKDLQTNEQIAETDTTEDYLKAINELKKNSVSRDEYVKLREENKELLNSLINGSVGSIEKTEEQEVVDIPQLRRDLLSKEMTNLDYTKTMLKLRSALIAKGESDPFLPQGHDITITDDDVEKAKKTADVLQECVDYADGNASVFIDELQRRII